MKKWQEERNYRRVRNEGGEVIANIITVDGMDVEVPEDVYLAYAQADRRERYIMEEQSSGKLLSLEQMEEDALLPDYVGAETAPSAETEALEREELRNLAEQKQILLLALLSLKDTDRELINALFFDGASTREYDKKVDTNLGVGSFIALVNGKTGELTLEANRSGTDEGQFGAITVTISTSNYQDITLTVNIFAKNKLTPVMDGKITASKITYGQALSDSSITGKMKDPNTGATVNGTFTWTDGTIKPDANDRYEAEWTFTPDSEEYATVTDTATVEVAPKSIEGAVITLESADLEYNAAEQSPKITGVALEK